MIDREDDGLLPIRTVTEAVMSDPDPGAAVRDPATPEEVRDWLLSGDPAITWQVHRDLGGRPASEWQTVRSRVATTGWGAELLSHRDPAGTWAGGWYSPKWTSTFYSMQLLVALGADDRVPEVAETATLMLDHGVRDGGEVVLWQTPRPDTCVTGMLLTTASSAGLADQPACRAMVGWLLEQQMDDGGWNCRRPRATHSSFHTTVSVLEGLHAWARGERAAAAAADRGREFLLDHRLYRSHTSGHVVQPTMTRFSFPHWWYYDVLRALDHFRAVDAPWDDRLTEPVELVERRGASGTWKLQNRHPGLTWFEMEQVGRPSRWNTLRALRVLRWAGAARSGVVPEDVGRGRRGGYAAEL